MPDQNQTPPEFLPPPPPPVSSLPVPQFATAEYAHVPGSERCRICGSLVSGEYYRLNDQMVCSTCGHQLRSGQPADSHAAFLRGLLLGLGAAILGLTVYAGFMIVTNIYLSYLALGVGWLIGKAIMKGSNGVGGLRYQIAAVALTYFSISVAAVPIGIHNYMERISSDLSVVRLIAEEWPRLLVQGLASPFLELRQPFFGILGLVILFVGIRVAWQLTVARRLPIEGPFRVGSFPAATA